MFVKFVLQPTEVIEDTIQYSVSQTKFHNHWYRIHYTGSLIYCPNFISYLKYERERAKSWMLQSVWSTIVIALPKQKTRNLFYVLPLCPCLKTLDPHGETSTLWLASRIWSHVRGFFHCHSLSLHGHHVLSYRPNSLLGSEGYLLQVLPNQWAMNCYPVFVVPCGLS